MTETQETPAYTGLSATYSPDDNKLRLYAAARLGTDTYARVKAAGFIWAPKQQLFVAPMWTPDREDLLLELAGEIDDDDTSLTDRAEERSERFGDYHESRLKDAESARAAVSAIADNIPLGQPILVGHHSERHARKDAERIENGMRRAVKMWDTAQYWKSRAAGAIRHAKYKERPDVRARRIKGIEADKRKQERCKADADAYLRAFDAVDQIDRWKPREDGSIPTRQERAHYISGRLPGGPYMATVRLEGANATTLRYGPYDVLASDEKRYQHCPAMSVDDVVAKLAIWRDQTYAYCDRWIAHYNNRLEYERAMLAEAGGLITDRTDYPIVPGGRVLVRGEWLTVIRVNRTEGRIASVTTNSRYVRVKGIEDVQDYQPPTTEALKAVKQAKKLPPIINEDIPGAEHLTKVEFDARRKHSDFYHYRVQPASDQFAAYRQAAGYRGGRQTTIFFTDQKVKPRPPIEEAIERQPLPAPERDASIAEQADRLRQSNDARAERQAEAAPFETLRDAAKAGVQVVSAPQLFPTPRVVAERVIELADIGEGDRVLEPSAGLGALAAIVATRTRGTLLCVEINPTMALGLTRAGYVVEQADFLTCNGNLGTFDRIVMNPPFVNGSDIKHIEHARTFLKPGGILVAICAGGPLQTEKYADYIVEELPAGTFEGTGVRSLILRIEAE